MGLTGELGKGYRLMLYIRPTENGYEAYDVYHHFVFEEKGCNLLFSFLESNSDTLSAKLKAFFDKRIDRETLSEKDGKVSKALCEGIKKEMERIHPYLSANNYIMMFTMLAEYLSVCAYMNNPDQIIPFDDYSRLYSHLIQPLLSINPHPLPPAIVPTSDTFINKNYQLLESTYKKKATPLSFRYTDRVREEAERYVYWVLDQSAFRFKDLDRGTRVRLYSRVFRKSIIDSDLRFISRYYWKEPEAYDYFANTGEGLLIQGIQNGLSVEEASARAEQKIQERRDRRDMANYMALLNSDRQQLSDELKAYMDEEISAAREETTATLFEEYQVDNLYGLIQLQMWFLSKGDTILKRCRHCGRLFIAEKTSVDYCTRIMEGETEPCNIVGPKKAFSRRLDEDHTLKTYNRVYKTIYTRMKRGSMSAEEFNAWKTEARRLLEKTRAGEMSEEEFIAWLTQGIRAWGTMNRSEESEIRKLGE